MPTIFILLMSRWIDLVVITFGFLSFAFGWWVIYNETIYRMFGGFGALIITIIAWDFSFFIYWDKFIKRK